MYFDGDLNKITPTLYLSILLTPRVDRKYDFTSKLDSSDGGRVVVQSLFQTVVFLQVEDVN